MRVQQFSTKIIVKFRIWKLDVSCHLGERQQRHYVKLVELSVFMFVEYMYAITHVFESDCCLYIKQNEKKTHKIMRKR